MTALRQWQWRTRPVDRDRRGELCKVLVRAPTMNSVLVQFEDGRRFVTSRNGLGRRAWPCTRCGERHTGKGEVCGGCDGGG